MLFSMVRPKTFEMKATDVIVILVHLFRDGRPIFCSGEIVAKNLAQKLIEDHLVSGSMQQGEEIGIRIDQTLTQDATGTMVMLELEAMGCQRVKTELSAQYVDHNLLETDFKNADDHLFLRSACQRFGIWYSRAGNGVSHPVHMERFGIPGKTLLGSDSHTCAAGSLGMLAIGVGGLEVAMAMMGSPLMIYMPKIFGIRLSGKLPDWVSAKDIILEVLRRHGVDGGVNKIIEYHGPGLTCLSAMDRHVIANMGAELGATTSIFPSDERTRSFLISQGRGDDWVELGADKGCRYDEEDEIDLANLEPLIACPSSPADVVSVSSIAKKPVYQSMVGSSANPGMRDFVIPALMLKDRMVHPQVSLEINPTSRQILADLSKEGYLNMLIGAGARIHQAGCNGCIGMGQAPATDKISLRTVPRNFPGRSGTKDDLVYLCSPETAVASAINGEITDPRTLGFSYPKYREPERHPQILHDIEAPIAGKDRPSLMMGPNIKPLPQFEAPVQGFKGPVLLKLGHNISTDEILPAGSRVLPFRSNVPKISEFAFSQIDEDFYKRALPYKDTGSIVVAGKNYGQGSSREHAAIATRFLGVLAVIALGYARIHRENLINFGVAPLVLVEEDALKNIDQGDVLSLDPFRESLKAAEPFDVTNETKGGTFAVRCPMSARERDLLLKGGLIPRVGSA